MNDYYNVRFELKPCTEVECDILSALLGNIGFESFVADETGVSAYVKKELFDKKAIETVLAQYEFSAQIHYAEQLIEGQDWNSEWEKHYFQPIAFKDLCVIHSSFHKDYPKAKYDIVIDPRMAFGTGHHETTTMMIERLLSLDIKGSSVLDMGTGTGILAILASMAGAKSVVGVEIDPPAYDNACDNIRLNGVPTVELRQGGAETVTENSAFDVVLANINRNIILADVATYANALKIGGRMILSGFYIDDVPLIEKAAKEVGLESKSVIEKKRWANLLLVKG